MITVITPITIIKSNFKIIGSKFGMDFLSEAFKAKERSNFMPLDGHMKSSSGAGWSLRGPLHSPLQENIEFNTSRAVKKCQITIDFFFIFYSQ